MREIDGGVRCSVLARGTEDREIEVRKKKGDGAGGTTNSAWRWRVAWAAFIGGGGGCCANARLLAFNGIATRRQAMKGRVGQAPWRARAALCVGGEAEALWRTSAVAAAGTALTRRAARRGDGTIRRLGGSGLALRGWHGATCYIAREAREPIPAFARLASRVPWLCCCCVHA